MVQYKKWYFGTILPPQSLIGYQVWYHTLGDRARLYEHVSTPLKCACPAAASGIRRWHSARGMVQKKRKAYEPGSGVPDRPGFVYSHSGEPISEYEYAREETMQKNQMFLQSLGLESAKKTLSGLHPKKKVGARGVSRRKRAAPAPPTRRSARARGEKADGLFIDKIENGKIVVSVENAGEKEAAGVVEGIKAEAKQQAPGRARFEVPDGPLTLESTNASEEHGMAFLAQLRRLSSEAEESGSAAPMTSTALEMAERMARLSVDDEESVCKVVPERIYGLAVHPRSSAILVAAGDKVGNLGLWNASDRDRNASDDDGGVVGYRPHSRTLNRLQYSAGGQKLYSWSYDGTVRCMDIEKGHFSLAYKQPDDDEGWLQSGLLRGNLLYVCDSDGTVACSDVRADAAKGNVWRKRLSEKKVNTVDVSPTDDWLLATSGLDRTVKLWDMRKAKKKELCALSYNRSTSSAFFNCDGTKLLITSMDDKLTILESPRAATGKTSVSKTLRHNNQTGRWLSVLHAMWHPRDPRAFVCGSLQQPRCVEVFYAEPKMRRIANIQGEFLGSVHSRNVFHDSLDVIVGANSSGRVAVMAEA